MPALTFAPSHTSWPNLIADAWRSVLVISFQCKPVEASTRWRA